MSGALENITIPTYIINLPERNERRKHIIAQFKGKTEFSIQVVEACEHKIEAIGLWRSMIKVIQLAIKNEDDVIIICEDDHEFTKAYQKEYLLTNIIEAHEQGVEILSGGIGNFGYALPLTLNRMWITPFQSTQFIVLYKSIFPKMLKYKFKKNDAADIVLSGLTSHKMILCPFISKKKDFGSSDIMAVYDEKPGLVQEMFVRTEERLERIRNAYIRYLS
ncbi:glycosyl transferase [Pedobacter sp. MR2016-19]|uniref:glycosyl transferase n=1 Tax=Pedobacter sp. MR2016-19 TaxID=2780089 RepID=UPI001875B8C7|nr:glycosyl transferase [Pedobacter sp. MR2016-19]MBE5322228.1 glycosyl transferase [Pedobacter sp. MR2016-19]